ncbi:MAG: YecA family protein [Desulfitobacteriaceae bacterium]
MAERNDPCPCMSGLKYKKCCLEREILLKRLPCQTYHENYALKNLVIDSPQFKSFYESERARITRNIIWAFDPDLRSNILASYLPDYKEHMIVFNTVPISFDDAFATAHELQHFICFEEGYPNVSTSELFNKPVNAKLAAALGSSLIDPIVNKRLIPYGFDLWAQYDNASIIQKNSIEHATEPQTPTEKLYSTAFYIGKSLDWDICCSSSPRDTNEFLLWYDSHYPNFSREAKEVLAWVKELGYETPEKLTTIFSKIIAQFELDKMLIVSAYL